MAPNRKHHNTTSGPRATLADNYQLWMDTICCLKYNPEVIGSLLLHRIEACAYVTELRFFGKRQVLLSYLHYANAANFSFQYFVFFE